MRIHDSNLQEYIFKEVLEVCSALKPFMALCFTLFQLTPQESSGFAELLRALRCGAPPHGGIALGKSLYCLFFPFPAHFSMILPRLRPPDGHYLQGPFNSRRYCLPEDGRRDRPNVQKPLSHFGGDARTLRLGPSVDSVMAPSSPHLYLVLNLITTQS